MSLGSYSLSKVITHAQCQQGLVDVFYNIVFDFQTKRQLLGRIDFPTNTDVYAQAGFVVRIVYPAEIVDMSSYMMEFPERQINAGQRIEPKYIAQLHDIVRIQVDGHRAQVVCLHKVSERGSDAYFIGNAIAVIKKSRQS